MFDKAVKFIENFDADLTKILSHFFEGFTPYKELPFFASHFTDFTKTIVYSFFILVPLLFLKILFPYKRRFTYPIFFVLGVIGISLVGIFLGFMQLLYA